MTVVRRAITRNELLVDVAIAAGLTALSVIAIAGGAGDSGGRDPLNAGLLLLQTVPLVLRRVAPVPVLTIAYAATFLHIINAWPVRPLDKIGA